MRRISDFHRALAVLGVVGVLGASTLVDASIDTGGCGTGPRLRNRVVPGHRQGVVQAAADDDLTRHRHDGAGDARLPDRGREPGGAGAVRQAHGDERAVHRELRAAHVRDDVLEHQLESEWRNGRAVGRPLGRVVGRTVAPPVRSPGHRHRLVRGPAAARQCRRGSDARRVVWCGIQTLRVQRGRWIEHDGRQHRATACCSRTSSTAPHWTPPSGGRIGWRAPTPRPPSRSTPRSSPATARPR